MTERWPVTILPVGPVAVATRIWRFRQTLHVTALAKATFAFTPGRPMVLSTPLPINVAEVPGGPMRTTGAFAPCDIVPLLPRADVTFSGHAYAPGRSGARNLRVRLALSRPREAGSGASDGPLLLDKSLEVIGTRTATRAWPNPPPALFTKMALVYERAYGGTEHHTNPIGTGAEADVRGRIHLPNVVHAPNTAVPVEPAGFAPVPIKWPLRTRLLPNLGDMLRAPVASLPDDIDLGHFHSAPFDQRIDFLRGDEWIILDKLTAKHERLETQLPGAIGVARVVTREGEQHELPMRADTLWIDGDAEVCTVVWRGSFPVPNDAALPLIAIAAGVQLRGAEPTWPAIDWPHAQGGSETQRPATPRISPLGGTVMITQNGGSEERPPPTQVLSSTFVRGGTLVIDTEAAASTQSPEAQAIASSKPSLARPSEGLPPRRQISVNMLAGGDEDTVDADSSGLAAEFADSLDGEDEMPLSTADIIVESTTHDDDADSTEDGPGPRLAPSPLSIASDPTDAEEPASVERPLEGLGQAVDSSRIGIEPPVPAVARASGVVSLSSWRGDDDDDDDDAATHVLPSPLDRDADAQRALTPPPDSVDRPTSSSQKTKRKP